MDVGGAFTNRLFAHAGIREGVSALDIGCGAGDVTFRVAQAVGPSRHVTGIDLNDAPLNAARAKAEERGIINVSFEKLAIAGVADRPNTYDVITCRRVLMYVPQQIETLKVLHQALRPGGMIVLQEHDASLLHSNHELPLYEQVRLWIWNTVKSEDANIRTGFDLYGILSVAGFSEIEITAEAPVLTPDNMGPMAQIVEAIQERIEAAGVASKEEMQVATLAERLETERRKRSATSVGELMFGAVALA